jgi:hypothetical protein
MSPRKGEKINLDQIFIKTCNTFKDEMNFVLSSNEWFEEIVFLTGNELKLEHFRVFRCFRPSSSTSLHRICLKCSLKMFNIFSQENYKMFVVWATKQNKTKL